MYQPDPGFVASDGLKTAVDLLSSHGALGADLPATLPETGIGEAWVLDQLAGHVLGEAAQLGAPTSLAHMDPPTPWITWAMSMWDASVNQNMLHDMSSPFATQAEARVMSWLTPYFGMQGGHFCSGSTVANLTAIWAARDAVGVKKVVTSDVAHLSVEKACRLLGLDLIKVPVNARGQLDASQAPDLDDACLVLTAGTTATGAIDPLDLAAQARWTHIDAAWAGPFRFSPAHSSKLDGIDEADSVAVSGHKLLFQPKDSAFVMFRELEQANEAISYGGGYLAKPNIGVAGSRGAAAVPMLAMLLAWGREGLAQRLDRLMEVSEQLANAIDASKHLELWGRPQTAVNVFRPTGGPAAELVDALPFGMLSKCVLDGQIWARSVAANPSVDVEQVIESILGVGQGDVQQAHRAGGQDVD